MKIDKFGTLDSSEKTIALLAEIWWPQTAKEEGDNASIALLCNIWKKRAELEMPRDVFITSRTVLRLKLGAWSMVK